VSVYPFIEAEKAGDHNVKRASSGRLRPAGLAASTFRARPVTVGGVSSPETGPDLQRADLSDLTGLERVACHVGVPSEGAPAGRGRAGLASSAGGS
jgi:hypothetical protein